MPNVPFTLPASLPAGQYLVRIESIALHDASTFGGAQFYVGTFYVILGHVASDNSQFIRSLVAKSMSPALVMEPQDLLFLSQGFTTAANLAS